MTVRLRLRVRVRVRVGVSVRVSVRVRIRVRVRVRVRVRASWLDELVRTLGALGVLELLLALVLRPVDAAHLLEVVLADEDHHALGVVDAAAPA